MTKEIHLSKGFIALVDDEDFEHLNRCSWCVRPSQNKYYATTTRGGKKNQVNILMHRMIMLPPDNMTVDHINGNGLDNRKENLRICYGFENSANKKRQINNTSGYKGVTWNQGKWQAQITKQNRHIYIGIFSKIEDAVDAYNKYSEKIHGVFGRPSDEK